MKKSFVLVVMVMAVLVIGSMSAVAAEDFDVVGGVTYNTFDGTLTEDGTKLGELNEELDSGFGFYIGGRYVINDSIAVGLGYDSASSSFTNEDVDITTKLSISGPYAEVVYSANENININGALVSYGLTVSNDTDIDYDLANGSGLGFKVGGEYNYDYSEQLAITGAVNYRIADLNIDKKNDIDVSDNKEKLNMSGLSASVGISYSF